MTTSKRRWTVEEDKVLTDQVSKNANNITRAFRVTSTMLEDRTAAACRFRWYGTLCKKGICFATIGVKTKNVNRKNVSTKTSDNTQRISVSLWKKLMSFLKK